MRLFTRHSLRFPLRLLALAVYAATLAHVHPHLLLTAGEVATAVVPAASQPQHTAANAAHPCLLCQALAGADLPTPPARDLLPTAPEASPRPAAESAPAAAPDLAAFGPRGPPFLPAHSHA